MIEISIIELVFYTFGTIVLGAAIGATIGVAVTIVYFENERR